MTWQIDALSNRDREALGSLVGRLMAEPSLRVQRIVLYGSKAHMKIRQSLTSMSWWSRQMTGGC